MYMRLAFSVAVSVDPDILLLDEVLAVGDEAFAAKCFARIQEFKKRGRTIVLVTHSTATLRDFCESAIWIDEGSIRLHGACDQVAEAYHQTMQAQAIAG